MPHRVEELTRREIRAHKHSEKSRVRSRLRSLTGAAGIDVDDIPEPGFAWKTPQKGWDPDKRSKNSQKHWRTPYWKRRTAVRAEKARQIAASR